jgi:hypothetical protein
MAGTLPIPEHDQIALEFLSESDFEFAAGKRMKASEMLWGAAAHALIAVALQQGRPYNSHGALKNVAWHLLNVPGQTHWLTEFDAAERYHNHFYHGHLTDEELMKNRPRVHRFVNRLLAVARPTDEQELTP